MPFSILFSGSVPATERESRDAPSCFHDLCLDQIVASITAGRDEYDLTPFFHVPLTDVESVSYRQEVFRDLQVPQIRSPVSSFAGTMRRMRSHLQQEKDLHHPLQKQRWHLDAAIRYCEAVDTLAAELDAAPVRSRGLLALRDFLLAYASSDELAGLRAESRKLHDDVAGIQYSVRLQGRLIEVSRHAGEPDYAAEVLKTFEKLRQADAREPVFRLDSWPSMNHVEAAILDRVARLYPEVFDSLAQFCQLHRDFVDPTVQAFDREVQVYLACLEHQQRIQTAGLQFCYPVVSVNLKAVRAREAFDLALAQRLLGQGKEVVTNDFSVQGPERVLVVSGANQGGKTTFARMLGQLHYLAALGCPVPGREAALLLCDHFFTHFEREEKIERLASRLEESLLRMHVILEQATSRSLLILNESFGSTTLQDAVFLSKQILQAVIERDMLCVCVTFLDELAVLAPATASFVATVDPEDPVRRTFKVVRGAPTGLAYALALAGKHGLTCERVKERIAL